MSSPRRLQCLQSLRTKRWASTPSSELESKKGSTPMSIKRATVEGASLVCTVASTKWPVSEAWMAI